jgi:hypothetical protein
VLSNGDGASLLAKWQAAATALQTDAQAAISNPPPACSDAADYGLAMQDYTTEAQDGLSAISDVNSGNYTAAIPLINASRAATGRGNRALNRSTNALNGLGG